MCVRLSHPPMPPATPSSTQNHFRTFPFWVSSPPDVRSSRYEAEAGSADSRTFGHIQTAARKFQQQTRLCCHRGAPQATAFRWRTVCARPSFTSPSVEVKVHIMYIICAHKDRRTIASFKGGLRIHSFDTAASGPRSWCDNSRCESLVCAVTRDISRCSVLVSCNFCEQNIRR